MTMGRSLLATRGNGLSMMLIAFFTLLATLIALGHITIDEYVESGGATPPADLLRHHVADLRRLLT